MLNEASLLSGSTRRLLDTFRANGIACDVTDGSLNLIGYQTKDGDWRSLKGLLSEKVPIFSGQICHNKKWTSRFFRELELSHPITISLKNEAELRKFIATHKNVVVKPRDGAHGQGVTMNVTEMTDLGIPIASAKKYDPHILMQQQVEGKDLRVLVIGDEVVSVLERRPASVVGDGEHTIDELVTIENDRPERGRLGVDTLVEISHSAVKQFLDEDERRFVPKNGENVRVVGPSNQSMGGTVYDVTDSLPEAIRKDALRITNNLKLPIAGVDCLLNSDGYYFLEINASPGIAIHDNVELGIQSGCFTKYMQLLYEDTWWRE